MNLYALKSCIDRQQRTHTLLLVIVALERSMFNVPDGYQEALQRVVWELGKNLSDCNMVPRAPLRASAQQGDCV